MYKVYVHHFPNGKKYVGITKEPVKKRWRNGEGYKTQPKIYNAIVKYGWDNIKHEVVVDGVSEEAAKTLEKYLINVFDSLENGYNSTIGGDNVVTCYYSSELSEFIRYAIQFCRDFDISGKKFEYYQSQRCNKRIADELNNMHRMVQTVTMEKFGKDFSPSDCLDNARFWHEIDYIIELEEAVRNGKEPPKYISFGQCAHNYFFK